jgi:hypothetical protein
MKTDLLSCSGVGLSVGSRLILALVFDFCILAEIFLKRCNSFLATDSCFFVLRRAMGSTSSLAFPGTSTTQFFSFSARAFLKPNLGTHFWRENI